LHRQSLLYQLNKIEELTSLSLKNNNDVFLLEICMRLLSDFYDDLASDDECVLEYIDDLVALIG